MIDGYGEIIVNIFFDGCLQFAILLNFNKVNVNPIICKYDAIFPKFSTCGSLKLSQKYYNLDIRLYQSCVRICIRYIDLKCFILTRAFGSNLQMVKSLFLVNISLNILFSYQYEYNSAYSLFQLSWPLK